MAASTPAATSDPAAGEVVQLAADSPFLATSFGELPEPWAIKMEPGTGHLFITLKQGDMRFLDPATGKFGTVSGLPEVAYGGQGGLGDLTFAPDYATSKRIYLSWAQAAGDGTYRAVAGMGTMVCSDAATCRIDGLREIWRQEPAVEGRGHYSHRFAFSPDGQHLFIASGDRQKQTPAQNLSNTLGTVVRLLPDGTPAPGNPFADQGSPTDQIWSYGHRNILGLVFDDSGQLWDLEHGPKGGDELNKVERGANYGWPVRSNGINYNGSNIPNHTADDGFSKPAIYWTPVIAPGGMIFYDGAMFDAWRGQALIANLAAKSISRVSVNATTNTASEESRYDFPNRLRDITQGADGALWVIEDGDEGRLLRLTAK